MSPLLGGPGKIVEIDESKFGKRKYNRGHLVEGQWVFGGVERENGNFFLVPVERRNRDTLIPIIQEWILPGTTIISDCWAPYNILDQLDYHHLTVNHSNNFVDPVTGACTNTIEGLWRHAKHRVPQYRRVKSFFLGYLARFMFITRCRRQNLDPTVEFLKAAGSLYNVNSPPDNIPEESPLRPPRPPPDDHYDDDDDGN